MQTELRVDDLARLLGVSSLTIRRDLAELASNAAILRTHGGCIAAGRAALETGYHQKVAQNFALKQALAGWEFCEKPVQECIMSRRCRSCMRICWP